MHHSRSVTLPKESLATYEVVEKLIDEEVASLEEELVSVRRFLHSHPEVSGQERETTKFIAERLSQIDLKLNVGPNEVGGFVDLTLGMPSENVPLIALRTDIDGLAIPDEKTCAYKSQNSGVAHVCGHDAHSTIILGIALAASRLSQQPGKLPPGFGLKLRFLFQPAEEICQGAKWLVEQGALAGVNGIIGLHVDPERTVGTVGIRYGALTAHCDEVAFEVHGKGGHAARPHHSIDPICASAQLISALYQGLPRSVDSRNPTVFSVGQVVGGFAPNAIPDTVKLRGSLRTIDQTARQTKKKRIAEIVEGVAKLSGTDIRVEFLSPLDAVVNDVRFAAVLEESSQRVLGSENVEIISQPSMGGEDFSVYLKQVPGALLRLGCASKAGESPFLHSPFFDIEEDCLAVGAKILFRSAVMLSLTLNSNSHSSPPK